MVDCCLQAAVQRAMVQSAVESAALAARPGPQPAHDAAAVGPSAAAFAGSAPGGPATSPRAVSVRSSDMVNPRPADAAAAAAMGALSDPKTSASTEEAAAGLARRVAALTAERRVLKAVARLSLAVTTDVLTGATLPYPNHTTTRCNKLCVQGVMRLPVHWPSAVCGAAAGTELDEDVHLGERRPVDCVSGDVTTAGCTLGTSSCTKQASNSCVGSCTPCCLCVELAKNRIFCKPAHG